MARLPRLSLPGQVHHIIQRGNNGQPIFSSSADHQLLLDLVGDHALKSGVTVHGYVLMSSYLHLLATPDTEGGLARMMQAVGRRYVRYFNDTQGRSGTLWDGRYRSTLIQADAYLLDSMVYMDLSPVRAGLVQQARDYPWSSHGHYTGLRSDKLVSPHPLCWTLGNTPFAREATYAERVQGGLSAAREHMLEQAVRSGWPLGEPSFMRDLEKRAGRRVVRSLPGRPAGRVTSGP